MRNLKAEMQRHGVSTEDISLLLNCSERTVRNKLSGATRFTYLEAKKIRDTYFRSIRLEYLFASELETAQSQK